MKDLERLRGAVIGLIAFAGAEDEVLIAQSATSAEDEGGPQLWAAGPLIAHNAEFRRQQVLRFEAIRHGETPPAFPDIDHGSEQVYRRYCEQSRTVAEESRATTLALIDEVRLASDEDLIDPSRHSWLEGRHLWLQTVVRGFWHPTGHLGEFYLVHGRPELAVDLHGRAVALAMFLSAPDGARGMASYNLACAQARADMPAEALAALQQAVDYNPQLGPKALGDPDLADLKRDGRLEALVGST